MKTRRQAFKPIDANSNRLQSPTTGGKSKGVTADTSCSKPIASKSERAALSVKSQVLRVVASPPASPTERQPTAPEQKAELGQVCERGVGVVEDRAGDVAEIEESPWSFDDFDFVRKLGSGACATVYAARERQSGHVFALKIQDADAGECYFDDEVDIHVPLEHSSIVNMVDYFYSDVPFVDPSEKHDDLEESSSTKLCSRYLCMILELCDGKDLYDTMRAAANKRFDEARAAKYFKSALDSLDYVHAAEIIHCDIKPSNFIVHGDGLKLADFGMAVRSEEREVIGGSPVYMSPEHVVAWRTDSDEFDHRVDVYSLGVVLYELLIGRLPYEVIEDDEDLADYMLLSEMGRTNICGDKRLQAPVLDLRRLNDCNADADEPFELPAPKFPDFVSEEAKDLILCLMKPCAEKRITIADARRHSWLKNF